MLITVLALTAGPTSAQVITWNIGTGNWSSGANWNPNDVPDSPAKSATVSNGGTVTLDASFTINNLSLSNGTINGPGNLNLAGAGSTWTGGTMSGAGTTALLVGGTLAIPNTGNPTLTARPLTNAGTVNYSPSSYLILNGAGGSLANLSGGLWDFKNDRVFNVTGAWAFDNQSGATLRKSTLAGTLPFNLPLTNAGTVEVLGGIFSLDAGGSSTGAFALAAGSTLRFASHFTLGAGATITGTGTLQVASGTTTFSGAVANPTAALSLTGGTANVTTATSISGPIDLTGGTLGDAGTLTAAGPFNWNYGDMTGGGVLNANAGGTWATGNAKYLSAHTLNLDGTTAWTAGPIYTGGGSILAIKPGATFTTDFDSGLYFNLPGTRATLDNQGTFTKSAGTGITEIQALFNNAATGTLDVQSGTLKLSGGGSHSAAATVAVASGATLNFSAGTFTMANGASFTGAGTFALAGGTLAIAAGTANLAHLTSTDGTLSGAGNATLGLLAQTGGSLAIDHFSLTGPGSTWTAGNWNSPAPSTATLARGATLSLISGNLHDFDYRAVTNLGTVHWNLGYLRAGHGATFTNAAGATFNDLSTSGYSIHNPFGGTFRFINQGTYTRNAAGHTSFIDVPFDNTGAVTVTAGDLQLRAGGTMGSSGTMTTAAGSSLTFTAGYTVANGTSFTGPGTYTLAGGTFDVTGTMTVSTFNQTGGTLAGSNALAGTINWSGGDWNSAMAGTSTTVLATGTLNLNTGSSKDFNRRAITNEGTVNWHTGYIRSGTGGTFTNAAGATFNDFNPSGSSLHNAYGGTFTFTNHGTYNRNAANSTSYLAVPFDNPGRVNVLAGDLQLSAGGTMANTGAIAAATGTNVYFTHGYTIDNGASLSGAGTYWLTGGTLTLTGNVVVGTFNQTGGTLAGTNTLNGLVNWSGGDWSAPAAGFTTTIAPAATLNLTTGNSKDFAYRAIVNRGIVNWTSGYLRGGHGATFTNAAGATFNDLNTSGYTVHNPFGGTFTFVNDGTYVRDVPGTTNFDAPFNNSGTLTLSLGSLQVRQGGTMSATSVVHAAAGTTLTFTASYTLLAGSQLGGAGTYTQTGGTLTVETLNASAFHWSAGNWNGAGTSLIAPTTVLNIGTGNDHDFDARSLLNHGLVNWSAGRLRSGHSGSIVNAGTWNDASGYSFNNDYTGPTATFTNAAGATYLKTAGTSTYFVPFTNAGTLRAEGGTLRFENTFTNAGGTLVAAGGTFSFAQALDLGTGTLGGSGTITAPAVTAGGTVAPGNSPGQLTLTGNLTLLSTTTFLVELAGPTQGVSYDFLSVGGNATLAGNLSVSFLHGFNTSVDAASSFTVLTATTLTGAFTNAAHGQRILSGDGLASFFVNYGAASPFGAGNVVLTHFIPVPEPSTYALLGLGLIGVLVAARRRRNS